MFLKNILFAFLINMFMVKRMIALNWITCSYYPSHGIFSELFSEYKICYSQEPIECCPGHPKKASEACCLKSNPKPTPTRKPSFSSASYSAIIFTTNPYSKIIQDLTSLSKIDKTVPFVLKIDDDINVTKAKVVDWWVWFILSIVCALVLIGSIGTLIGIWFYSSKKKFNSVSPHNLVIKVKPANKLNIVNEPIFEHQISKKQATSELNSIPTDIESRSPFNFPNQEHIFNEEKKSYQKSHGNNQFLKNNLESINLSINFNYKTHSKIPQESLIKNESVEKSLIKQEVFEFIPFNNKPSVIEISSDFIDQPMPVLAGSNIFN